MTHVIIGAGVISGTLVDKIRRMSPAKSAEFRDRSPNGRVPSVRCWHLAAGSCSFSSDFPGIRLHPPMNDADRVALFSGMAAYTGTVRLDGPGRFITTVDLSWNPAYGGEQLRLFTLVDDILTIRTPEMTVPMFPGRVHVGELVFNREHRAL